MIGLLNVGDQVSSIEDPKRKGIIVGFEADEVTVRWSDGQVEAVHQDDLLW